MIASPRIIHPGQICGFFDQGVFLLGLLQLAADHQCKVTGQDNRLYELHSSRLVLLSAEVFPLQSPAAVLGNFLQSMEECSAGLVLSSVRKSLLQSGKALLLQEVIDCCDLPSSDACRFALFLALRAKPEWFSCKKGLYRALTDEQEHDYLEAESWKELRRQELEICPVLARRGLPVLFPEAVLRSALELDERQRLSNRIDLTALECFSIDAESSQDLDDAISLETRDKGWELGIHISAVGDFVVPGGSLDMEAYRRVSSVYLPDLDVHMLPPTLSCDRASLLEGEVRPALSVICGISAEHRIESFRIVQSMIRVHRNYSYAEIDSHLSCGYRNTELQSKLDALQTITAQHLQLRIEQGAIIWEEPDKSPARLIVAECMVIYNHILAELCAENSLPLFYRHTEAIPATNAAGSSDAAFITTSLLGTEPRPHVAMGLRSYAQFSSPLRRYSDLINQRQLTAFCLQQPLPYTRKQLDDMIEHLAHTRNLIRQITTRTENS